MLRTCMAAVLVIAVFGLAPPILMWAGGLPPAPPAAAPEAEPAPAPPVSDLPEEFGEEPDFPLEPCEPAAEDFTLPEEGPAAHDSGGAGRIWLLLVFLGAVAAALILIRSLKGAD